LQARQNVIGEGQKRLMAERRDTKFHLHSERWRGFGAPASVQQDYLMARSTHLKPDGYILSA
jgi:hypothetical protein